MMLKNNIKIAFRNIFSNRLYSFLNIAGLSIGIACSLLILFYVQDELSYDRFHEKADRISRLNATLILPDRTFRGAFSTHVTAPMLQAEFPEIVAYVRFSRYGDKKLVQYKDYTYYEEKFLWVDASVFDVFSFKLVMGNPKEALVRTNSLVITEDMAKKYFGSEDPLGKQVRVNSEALYEVTGVMENIPRTSHIRPNFFASMSTLNLRPSGHIAQDLLTEIQYYTYLQLREETNPELFERKLDEFTERHLGALMKNAGGAVKFELQPLKQIYLYSDREGELERTGDVSYIYLLSGIGLFILLLACLNFMNLSTARSAKRAKEVGLRKAVGASRRQLIVQFLGESTILAFIAVLISGILVFLSMGVFRNVSGKDMTFHFFANPVFLIGICGLFVVIGLIGGSYPAFFLSAFRPVETLQGKLKKGTKGSILRASLVTLQFTVSIILIIGTLIVNRQLSYIQNKDLGYDKEQVLSIRMRNPATQQRYEVLKNAFRQHTNVLAVSASATTPLGFNDHRAEHVVGRPADELFMMFAQFVDEDFIDCYNMKIVRGRNFSKEYSSDAENAIIINETTQKKLGWQNDPIHKEIEVFSSVAMTEIRFKVIGVVQDYHFQSLHEEISPLVLFRTPLFGNFNVISVKAGADNIRETIKFLQSKWQEFDPDYPFEFAFVDDQFDALYRTEERIGQLFGYFTALAIIIGCLGLFGLTSFIAEQRTKEIGIRKVLGASSPGIVVMLVREFAKWVLLAVAIAWPVGYFVMRTWLQNFAYRTSLGIDTFVLAAILALAVALLTVSYQTIRVALTNPSDSLKYE
ncbi:MAG: ABC transporter permease [Candidatus Aminicenantes bacterium]|nr:ABC transporter permease [Candidatus Aminicenantes bacterium]